MRWYMRKSFHAATAIGSLAIMLAACSSSGSKTASGGSGTVPKGGCPGDPANQIYSPNSGGVPKAGGTLTVLGQGDVDEALDINIGYGTLDYLAYALYNRPLYSYPSTVCQTFTVEPDIATGPPVVTDNGLKWAVTIRSGAMWDTSPPRQVNAEDVIRGLKRSCNPNTPFGGQPDFSDLLPGYATFCNGFANVNPNSAPAMAAYINGHDISDVTVDPSNPLTVDFTLAKSASYFEGVLSLPPFSPAPIESLQSVPASSTAWQTVMSDGPYKIQSYDPGKSIVFVRNTAWTPASDPMDQAYVNQIDVSETGNDQGIYQQILTNSPQADMMWDVHVPSSDIPGLIAGKDPRFQLLTEGAANPWLVYNTVSPNNDKALADPVVRQAISYAIDRTELLQDNGGPDVAVPLTHVLAAGTQGSTPDFDPYPYNPTKAKQLLAQSGHAHLTLTLLYRQSTAASKDFQTLQALLGQVGITLKGLGLSGGDLYGKYLNPGTPAQQGAWDIAEIGWGPDWFPTGAKSWFSPILASSSVPPNASNFGYFKDPKLDTLISEALAAPADSAASLWHQADVEAMSQAPIYPIAQPNEAFLEGSQVHNCVIVQPFQNCNLANVWLSS